jgi:hypothetical protein
LKGYAGNTFKTTSSTQNYPLGTSKSKQQLCIDCYADEISFTTGIGIDGQIVITEDMML